MSISRNTDSPSKKVQFDHSINETPSADDEFDRENSYLDYKDIQLQQHYPQRNSNVYSPNPQNPRYYRSTGASPRRTPGK